MTNWRRSRPAARASAISGWATRRIARFQTEVDWTAPDAARRANLLMRQMMLGHAQAYLKGGDAALGVAHNEKTPRVAADEFHALLYQSTTLYELAPAFAAYLEQFPAASLPGAEQFLYWAKGGAGPDASISLHQIVIYTAPGGEVFVADKQIYASRYTDAAIVDHLARLQPGRQGLLRRDRRAGQVDDARRDGGAHAARPRREARPPARPRCTWTGSSRACRWRGDGPETPLWRRSPRRHHETIRSDST